MSFEKEKANNYLKLKDFVLQARAQNFLQALSKWIDDLYAIHKKPFGQNSESIDPVIKRFILLREFASNKLNNGDYIALKILEELYTNPAKASNCSDCNAYCCIHLFIREEKSNFHKLAGEKCKQLDDRGKCKIHEDSNRPEVCKMYHCYGAGPASAALHGIVASVSEKLCHKNFKEAATNKAMEYIFRNLNSGERNIVVALSYIRRVKNKEKVKKIERGIKDWNLRRTSLAFAFYKILLDTIEENRTSITGKDLAVHFELSHGMSLDFNIAYNFPLLDISEHILYQAELLTKQQN